MHKLLACPICRYPFGSGGNLVIISLCLPLSKSLFIMNLDLFRRMKNGEFPDGSKVLRAKIDMASPNINMRDPIIYRILRETHHRTGDKWCIYPMYDFAHPLEDAFEGITHYHLDWIFNHHCSVCICVQIFSYAKLKHRVCKT